MSTQVSRIPAEFNAYLNKTDAYQLGEDPNNTGNPRWKRWWNDQNSADWHTKTEEWSNPDTGLYTFYISDNTKTKTVTKDIHEFIKNFKVLGKFLQCWPQSNF